MKRKLMVMALLLCGAIYASAQTFSNPVIRGNCPDPTVLDDRARTGWFYVYSTQTIMSGQSSIAGDTAGNGSEASGKGKTVNLPIYRSKNLVDWEFVGDGFPDGRPDWVEGSKLWAPDINYIDGKYVLYYALGVWGGIFVEGSGVAVSDSPFGPFEDCGEVVSFKKNGVLNSIDPNFFEDSDGKRYLYWGSLGGGIHGIELSSDGLSVAPKAKPKHLSARNMEGAFMYKRGGWYYLFASMGSCCEGEKSTYRLVVARSRNPLGKFKGPDGQSLRSLNYSNVIMSAPESGEFAGPGHDSEIITDADGSDWMLYHTYWNGTSYNGRCMALDRIVWDEKGWPHFESGHPSTVSAVPAF